MNTFNPIDLLFGGMEKLGPGDNVHTLNVLGLLPKQTFNLIIDAGCGTGRQTIALARKLGTLVHALDMHQPFLDDLTRRAKAAGIEHLIQTYCMDMKDIPGTFQHIDLLWSEGAAYNIGFSNALTIWASAIDVGGFAVVSEMSWMHPEVPDTVKEFFLSEYPGMQSIQQNLTDAERAGYRAITTYTLPRESWVKGYYDILEKRAKILMSHPDPSLRDFAVKTLREIEIFKYSEDSYGYVFYLLKRA